MSSRYCKQCQRQVRAAVIYEPNHLIHLLVSLVTCGLWLPFWFLACLMSFVQGYCCPTCGKHL